MLNRLGRMFSIPVCVCVLACASNAHAGDQQARIQHLVDDLKARLSIAQRVDVSIVATNPKLFSVVPAGQDHATCLLSVEEDFAQTLTDDELRAALAHELGHVWIFTHFPFLQTEQLANDIASRVVRRDSLAPLYDKVWKKVGGAD